MRGSAPRSFGSPLFCIAFLLTCALAASAHADDIVMPCRFASVKLDHEIVEVRPADVPPFEMRLGKVGVSAQLEGRVAHLTVTGEIAFTAIKQLDEMRLAVRHGASSEQGRLKLGTEWQALASEVVGDRATLTLDNEWTRIFDVRFACHDLLLNERTGAWDSPPLWRGQPTGWLAPQRFTLGEEETTRGLVFESTRSLPVVVLEQRGTMRRVQLHLDDHGSLAEGWLAAALLLPANPDQPLPPRAYRGGGSACGQAYGRGIRFGPGRVRAGAPIFAYEDGRGEWARATPALDRTWIFHLLSKDYAAAYVPGVFTHGCTGHRIFVRRSDLTFGVLQKDGLSLTFTEYGADVVVRAADERWTRRGLRSGDRLLRFGTKKSRLALNEAVLREATSYLAEQPLVINRAGTQLTLPRTKRWWSD